MRLRFWILVGSSVWSWLTPPDWSTVALVLRSAPLRLVSLSLVPVCTAPLRCDLPPLSLVPLSPVPVCTGLARFRASVRWPIHARSRTCSGLTAPVPLPHPLINVIILPRPYFACAHCHSTSTIYQYDFAQIGSRFCHCLVRHYIG